MAKSTGDDPRPMIVFTISDCDPAGWQMPVSIARKLQAFKVHNFPDMCFQVRRTALLFDHVKEFRLPGSPLKETERRADKWRQATGLEQTEVDAMVTLHPGEFEEIIVDAIAPFFDRTLARRVAAARAKWLAEAQALVDDHTDHDALAEANRRLSELRDHVETEIGEINTMASHALDDDLALPNLVVPKPKDNSASAPEPLVDSESDFVSQCRRLIVSKHEYREDHDLPPPE
jgi:hypothetical protein